MVSELKTGFTSALLELSQIQHGDTYLREELEENRRSCQKKALRMEALVESLRVSSVTTERNLNVKTFGDSFTQHVVILQEELAVMRCQILQLYSNRPRPQQEVKSSTSKHRER